MIAALAKLWLLGERGQVSPSANDMLPTNIRRFAGGVENGNVGSYPHRAILNAMSGNSESGSIEIPQGQLAVRNQNTSCGDSES